MNKQYTLEEIQDFAVLSGFTPEKAEEFFHHYNAQGWLRANQLPITSIPSQLVNWRKNGYKFDKKKNGKKTKLFPNGHNCCKCKMPAIYTDHSGAYDVFYCGECMPDKVKAKYEA